MKLLFIALLVLVVPNHDGEWDLKKDKEGIKLYTKHVEGSTLKAIKANTTFHAPLEVCVAILRDIPNLNELFPDCIKVEKVMQSESEQIHYLQLKAPWPVTNRDGAFKLQYSYDASEETVIVRASMTSDKYPLQDGFVRLDAGGGTWKFKRLDAEHTELEYYYHGEPGGSIPSWLANSVVEENPYKMLSNFHSLLKLERYQRKTFSFLK